VSGKEINESTAADIMGLQSTEKPSAMTDERRKLVEDLERHCKIIRMKKGDWLTHANIVDQLAGKLRAYDAEHPEEVNE
jgi:hypothetical protein